jgi:hypothetical protein
MRRWSKKVCWKVGLEEGVCQEGVCWRWGITTLAYRVDDTKDVRGSRGNNAVICVR